MDRDPIPREESVVTKNMMFNIIFNGIVIFIIFIAENKFNILGAEEGQKSTVLFTLFVILQLFNAFNCRELTTQSIFKNFLQNKIMLGVFALTFLLQVIITQFGGRVFSTVPLSIEMWVKILVMSLIIIIASEAAKVVRWIINRKNV
jgi:Ca2+-transporting ATPase